MDRETFNSFCASLPHTTHVVQWGNSDVWKVGGKVFTVGGTGKQEAKSEQSERPGNLREPGYSVSFKCSEIAFEMLGNSPGCRPAPYLASRGMKWIQRLTDETVSDNDLRGYLKSSHRIVSLGLTKKLQKELGLNQENAK